jgi:hypothetical protein
MGFVPLDNRFGTPRLNAVLGCINIGLNHNDTAQPSPAGEGMMRDNNP